MSRIFILVLLVFPPLTQYILSQNIQIEANNSTIAANPPATNPNGECGARVSLKALIKGSTDCIDSDFLYFEVQIDNDNDGRINYIATSFCDTSWKDWTLDRTDNIFKKYLAPTAQNEVELEVDLGHQNIQNSKVIWKVLDACANITEANSEFNVSDRKSPTPYCVNISTFLFDGSQKSILSARYFDKGSFDNCTPHSELMFAFDPLGPVQQLATKDHYYKASQDGKESVEATEEEYEMGLASFWNSSLKSGEIYICPETSLYNRAVDIYLFDQAFNNDFCTVVLSRGPCVFPVHYQASINHVKGKPIKNATIHFKDEDIYCSLGKNNDTIFYYNNRTEKYFIDNIKHRKYTVKASLEQETNEGLDRKDIEILENHLSNKTPFKHYWQYIAADINEDKVIDATDLEILRSIIQNNLNTRWKIIPYDQENTINNWTLIQEEYTMTSVFGGPYYYSFMGIKIGDLNGDVFEEKPDLLAVDTDFFTKWRHEKDKVTFKPNPFRNTTQVEIFSQNDSKLYIEIYDLKGRQVLTKQNHLQVGKNTITISKDDWLVSGVYFFRMYKDDNVYTGKIVALD